MKHLLIDTDIGSDCDDAGALAIANQSVSHHNCEILGITHVATSKEGLALVDIIDRFYGHPNIPLGVNQTGHFLDDHRYRSFANDVFQCYSSPYLGETKAEEAVTLLRRVLAVHKDVTLVCIGPLVNLAHLLLSPGDAVSSLTGQELAKRSCSEVVIMGGSFLPSYINPEYNVSASIESTQSVASLLTVPCVFVPFEAGDHVFSGGKLVQEHAHDNPVALAYEIFAHGARESWDLVTMDYGIYGVQDCYSLSEKGQVTITEQGQTLFHASPNGNTRLLQLKAKEETVGKHLDSLLEEDSLPVRQHKIIQ